MPQCDLCNSFINGNATRFTAAQVRTAVRAGLRPPDQAAKLAAAFGLSPKDAEAAWIDQVMRDPTDWACCPGCAARVAGYLRPPVALVVGVVLVVVTLLGVLAWLVLR
jgi:hypothetical protein